VTTEDEIREAMKQVEDPELGVNVVDLGLLYGVSINEHGNVILGAAQVGKMLAGAMERRHAEHTGFKMKVRHKQIGYETRCAQPIAFDIMLGTQLGVGAYRAVAEEGLSGYMVSVKEQLQIDFVPFSDLVDPETLKTRIRYIDRESDFYKLARSLEYQQLEHPSPRCE